VVKAKHPHPLHSNIQYSVSIRGIPETDFDLFLIRFIFCNQLITADKLGKSGHTKRFQIISFEVV